MCVLCDYMFQLYTNDLLIYIYIYHRYNTEGVLGFLTYLTVLCLQDKSHTCAQKVSLCQSPTPPPQKSLYNVLQFNHLLCASLQL